MDARIMRPHYMFDWNVPIVLSAGTGSTGRRRFSIAQFLGVRRRTRLRAPGRRSQGACCAGMCPAGVSERTNLSRQTPGSGLKSDGREEQRERPHHDGYDRGPTREYQIGTAIIRNWDLQKIRRQNTGRLTLARMARGWSRRRTKRPGHWEISSYRQGEGTCP